MLLKYVYMGWKFQRTLKLDISFSLEHFFISVANFRQVASSPLTPDTHTSGTRTCAYQGIRNGSFFGKFCFLTTWMIPCWIWTTNSNPKSSSKLGNRDGVEKEIDYQNLKRHGILLLTIKLTAGGCSGKRLKNQDEWIVFVLRHLNKISPFQLRF